jgi:hypothetical protein
VGELVYVLTLAFGRSSDTRAETSHKTRTVSVMIEKGHSSLITKEGTSGNFLIDYSREGHYIYEIEPTKMLLNLQHPPNNSSFERRIERHVFVPLLAKTPLGESTHSSSIAANRQD